MFYNFYQKSLLQPLTFLYQKLGWYEMAVAYLLPLGALKTWTMWGQAVIPLVSQVYSTFLG